MPLSRSLYAITLAVILALSAVPVRAQTTWERFTHPTVGFSLSYPTGWVPTPMSHPSLHLILVGPSAAGAPDIPMGVMVMSVRAPSNLTAGQLLGTADEPLRDQVGDYHLLRVDRTKLNGIPAELAYATAHTKGKAIYVMVLLIVVNHRVYSVAGLTALDSTQLAEETRQLQAILVTFRAR